MFCCQDFEEHTNRKWHEAGAFILESDGVWAVAADGGANAINVMMFCPFCGKELNKPTDGVNDV